MPPITAVGVGLRPGRYEDEMPRFCAYYARKMPALMDEEARNVILSWGDELGTQVVERFLQSDDEPDR